jgi:hypothetical protein
VEKRGSNPSSRIVQGRFPFSLYSILDVPFYSISEQGRWLYITVYPDLKVSYYRLYQLVPVSEA